ncbi:MAG: sigma-70 family RNA polymerase sigma factor [Planctomycetales bacterium]
MNSPTFDSDELLAQAAAGDDGATQELFLRHRDRLRQMVAVRIDVRLKPRFDPSDVVQDALMDASRKLPEYLRNKPLPLYPWLRQLTLERLIQLHRQQIVADKRNPKHEVRADVPISDESAWQLADQLLGPSASNPLAQAIREERRRRVHEALEQLLPHEREILVLRYLEQLSTTETAAVLEVSESAAKMRHLRALDRIRTVLEKNSHPPMK